MAISLIQPLSLFLASLFFLPSLYAMKFEYCKGEPNNVGNVTALTRSPTDADNKYTLYVSIHTKKNFYIDPLSEAVVDVKNDEMEFSAGRYYRLTAIVDPWPIESDKDYNFTFTKVPSKSDYPEVSAKLYDRGTLMIIDLGREMHMCINFNPISSAASAAVSA